MGNANCSCKYSTNIVTDKRSKRTSKRTSHTKSLENLQFQVERPINLSNNDLKSSSFSPQTIPFGAIQKRKVKIMNLESPVGGGEKAYEGEDEYDDKSMPMKRDNSDFDIQAHSENSNEIKESVYSSFRFDVNNQYEVRTDKDSAIEDEVINKNRSGGMSDPGLNIQLKRSCSDPMMRGMVKVTGNLKCSNSFKEMQKPTKKMNDKILTDYDGSPLPMMTHFSANKVMLKKHSSSGSSSDTLKANKTTESRKSSGSFSGKSMRGGGGNNHDNYSCVGFQGNACFLPQNQRVSFPASTKSRVDQWVRELPVELPQLKHDGNYHIEDGTAIPLPVVAHPKMNIQEIVLANSVIQSLNSSTSVAHMAGIGLKAIPSISCYFSLRSVNLSGNYIVHITPGSLPKGLHILDLSRNKINTIEGLRELTHLRLLNLSYNCISRIGQGLSNCILIKELYLAGNKISEVEGLHRLLKVTILDLSFNKIIIAKALGQLVANYYSLLALNLLGNPVQSNISDDQLRKTICSLLPKLAYLNRQQVSPQKARDIHTEAILKGTMGDGGRSKRKNHVKRLNHANSSSFIANSSRIRSVHKSSHSSKRQRPHHSALKK